MQRKRKTSEKVTGILFGALLLYGMSAVFLSGCGKEESAFFLEESSTAESKQNSLTNEQTIEYSETKEEAESDRKEADLSETAEKVKSPAVCFVHICGAVNNPGVYELSEGSRIFEAVELAGGLTEEACTEYLNQAQKITDGMKLYVPTREQAENNEAWSPAEASFEADVFAKEETGGLVNINTADKAQLMTLPGIGESRAESILAYRKESGGFQRIEDIMQVSGIKEGAFQKLRDKICVK